MWPIEELARLDWDDRATGANRGGILPAERGFVALVVGASDHATVELRGLLHLTTRRLTGLTDLGSDLHLAT